MDLRSSLHKQVEHFPATCKSMILECSDAASRALVSLIFGKARRKSRKDRRQINPWGFADPEIEKKFVEQFWLMFAWNNRRLICSFYCLLGSFHIYTAGTELSKNFWSPLNIVCVMRMLMTTSIAVLFSRPHISSFARWLFWTVITTFVYCGPPLAALQSCAAGASTTKLFILTLAFAFWGPIVWPHWISTSVMVFIMGWVPFIWNSVHNFNDHSGAGRVAFGYLIVSIFGPLYGSLIAVHQRKAWLAQHKEASSASRNIEETKHDDRTRSRRSRSLDKRRPSVLAPLSEDAPSWRNEIRDPLQRTARARLFSNVPQVAQQASMAAWPKSGVDLTPVGREAVPRGRAARRSVSDGSSAPPGQESLVGSRFRQDHSAKRQRDVELL